MEQSLTELLLMIQKNAGSVVNFLDSFVPLLLSIVQRELKEDCDPIIVLQGLRVIKTFADFPLSIVFKYKTQVIRGLLPVLENQQRVIREYAARVRNLWFMIH